MRITCPYCGNRSLDEFLYHGDAEPQRPEATAAYAMDAFISYAFERTNPPGQHRELWYHEAGCHAWLVVTRNVLTHAISAVDIARDIAKARTPSTSGRA